MMAKWPPPIILLIIIIICPVKPAYFIVHNISMSLISLRLSLRTFQGFFLSPISFLGKLCELQSWFSSFAFASKEKEKENPQREDVKHTRGRVHLCISTNLFAAQRGLFPSRRPRAVLVGPDEDRRTRPDPPSLPNSLKTPINTAGGEFDATPQPLTNPAPFFFWGKQMRL